MVASVVVIGAGVYGAAVADALVRRGARVTVVDSGVPAGGTSGTTFSWLNSCGKQPRAYHDLNVAGMAAHRKLAADVPNCDWYHEGGNLEWADTDAGRARLRAKVAGVLDYGYEAHWLSRAETLGLEPDLDPAAVPADDIAYFPREAWIEAVRMIAHLLSSAVARGADVISGDAVVDIEVTGGQVRSMGLASGRRVAADVIVNCAGPRAADIAALVGLALPMANRMAVLIYTSPVAVSLGRVVHSPRVNLRPDGGGRILLHGEDFDDSGGDQSAVDSVVDAARTLYPGIRAAAVERVWSGERPIPDDGLPVLGRVAALPNFHFCVSHSGATLSVHVGDLVAAEALGDDQSDALGDYRFERFGTG